jgi:hypothetical protein
LPVASYQLSAISYQLSVVIHLVARVANKLASYKGIDLAMTDSYQGIALAIPQAPEIKSPFRGWASKVA